GLRLLLPHPHPQQHALLRLAHLVPRAGHQEAGGDDAVARDRLQHVAGELLLDELRVELVVVEGTDDVIAVTPGVVARLVALVALALAVAHDVEPVAAPALAPVGARPQSLPPPLLD